MKKLTLLIILFLTLTSLFEGNAYAKKENRVSKETYLTHLSNINITNETANNMDLMKQIIKEKKPRAIFVEEWLLSEPGNKKLLKTLQKLAKKYDSKLYLIIGRNSWFGKRGLTNTLNAYNTYSKYVDGIVLKVEPNKVNVWKDDTNIHAQILNQMLDGYSAIYTEAKKRNRKFIAEFPFWLSDYNGPLKNFSQNVCDYADKIIFLIDNEEKLDNLDIRWNDVPCPYIIDITKRACAKTEESINNIYNKINNKLTFYQNFQGFIIDSDTNFNAQDKLELPSVK